MTENPNNWLGYIAILLLAFASHSNAQVVGPSIKPSVMSSDSGPVVFGIAHPAPSYAQQDEFTQPSTYSWQTDSAPTAATEDSDQFIQTKVKRGFETVRVSAQDQIWVVSCRCDPTQDAVNPFHVARLQRGNWEASALSDLFRDHQTNTSLATMVFVHGNRYDLGLCKDRGLQFYHSIFQNDRERPPLRLVLFCWKSEVERLRPLPDFNIKSKRSVELGTAFGKFLCGFNSRKPLICSYSLGAQIVVKGLEAKDFEAKGLEARGFEARRLETPNLETSDFSSSPGYRVAMLAPAFDPDYACRSLENYCLNTAIAETRIFVNDNDLVIRAANLIVRKRCRDTLTVVGKLTRNGEKCEGLIDVHNVTAEVRKSHSLDSYTESATLGRILNQMLVEASVNPAIGSGIAMESESTVSKVAESGSDVSQGKAIGIQPLVAEAEELETVEGSFEIPSAHR
jgi:hypothetical protein